MTPGFSHSRGAGKHRGGSHIGEILSDGSEGELPQGGCKWWEELEEGQEVLLFSDHQPSVWPLHTGSMLLCGTLAFEFVFFAGGWLSL